MTGITPAALAAQDQAQARERNFERHAHNAMLFILWIGFSLGVYSFLAIRGDVPPMPWSPIGQYQQQQQDAPLEYKPSLPNAPSQDDAVEV